MARLSTHVLDTSRGRPAAGVRIELYACEGDQRRLICSVRTNSDGRTDKPLLEGSELVPGTYEIVFGAGEYFRTSGVVSAEPSFLDDVPVRFRVADAANYHVPLLLSPYGYTTYRGS
jgi:5-hydroxyisourate hydrolase